MWAVLSGSGTVTVAGQDITVDHPGAYELVRHVEHHAAVLDMVVSAGVTCHATCFEPGLAPAVA